MCYVVYLSKVAVISLKVRGQLLECFDEIN